MTDDRPKTRYDADRRRKEARQAAKVSHRWPLISAVVAVLLAVGLGAIIAYRGGNLPYSFDTEWMSEVVEHRGAAWDVPAQLMNTIGGGVVGVVVVPIGIVVLLCLLRRFWAALYFAVSSVLSAVLVQLLKGTFARPRPEDMLVAADLGSFPSGHVANAATMAVVLGFIVWRRWVWVAGAVYTVLMMISRTYLGAHWVSDTIGGLVLGAGVAVIIWAPLAQRLHRERQKHRNPSG
ncbi:MAG: phosphoesterase PA-phosphatase [Microbacteriaceae bacterium]|jgi:membrane-associated phospholipid phosphatase|nr:phosphoesterase PA-phosphatase [Microbacteriaceae bacterium]HEV7957569.1 phosphatase PAP2 family protein [Marisediminicola sp.]